MSVDKKRFNDHIDERGRFSRIPNEIWELDIDHYEKLIWSYIASRPSWWKSSRNNIASNLRLTTKTASKHLKTLVSLNMLAIKENEFGAWDFEIIPPNEWKTTAPIDGSNIEPDRDSGVNGPHQKLDSGVNGPHQKLDSGVNGPHQKLDSGVNGPHQKLDSGVLAPPHLIRVGELSGGKSEIPPKDFDTQVRAEIRTVIKENPGGFFSAICDYVTEVVLRYGNKVSLSNINNAIDRDVGDRLARKLKIRTKKAYDGALDIFNSSPTGLLEDDNAPYRSPAPGVTFKTVVSGLPKETSKERQDRLAQEYSSKFIEITDEEL
jgi:hypothetical protein